MGVAQKDSRSRWVEFNSRGRLESCKNRKEGETGVKPEEPGAKGRGTEG